MQHEIATEAWVRDPEARRFVIDKLLNQSDAQAMSDCPIQRCIGRFRSAICPHLVEWLASELRANTNRAEICFTFTVALVPYSSSFAELVLTKDGLKEFPAVSGKHLRETLQSALEASGSE